MSSLLKYLKKKFQPFKKQIVTCSNRSHSSFEESDGENRRPHTTPLNKKSKAIGKKRNNKSRERSASKARHAAQRTPAALKRLYGDDESGLDVHKSSVQIISASTILFNTPNSFSSSSKSFGGEIETSGLFVNSNIDVLRAANSGGGGIVNHQFVFDSISNAVNSADSTPNSTSGDQSMVTYNTKYANNSNANSDDGLVTHSVLSLAKNNSLQQSTPYIENFSQRNPSLRKSSSSTVNKVKSDDHQPQQSCVVAKYRRSNTTYTIGEPENARQEETEQQKQQANRIVEYFNKLDVNKAVKRKAHVRQLKSDNGQKQMKVENASEEVTNEHEKNSEVILDEIEKLHDAFFHDSPAESDCDEGDSLQKTAEKLSSSEYESRLKANNSTSSPLSTSKSFTTTSLSDFGSENNNETHLANKSMEKARRSVSSPKILGNQNSISCINNVSRLSLIKDLEPLTIKPIEEIPEPIKSNTTNETLSNINPSSLGETLASSTIGSVTKESDSSSSQATFIRGEKTRLSKNIKRMFKSVLDHQTSALQHLETFYEIQVSKIEMDRANTLKINPTEYEARINAYYDKQLQNLEQRVQLNLKMLLDNKSNVASARPPPPPSHALLQQKQKQQQPVFFQNNHHAKIAGGGGNPSNRTTPQLMLLLQMQQHQQQSNQIGQHQSRSRTLSGVKAGVLVGSNQASLLPSKCFPVVSKRFEATQNEVINVEKPIETSFKRNLSLPFKQSRKIIAEQKQISPKSSKIQCNQAILQNIQQPQIMGNQFVKNSAKKIMVDDIFDSPSTNHENEADDEYSPELDFKLAEENSNVLMANFAHIKRQNKSVSSMQPSQQQQHDANAGFFPIYDNSSFYSLNTMCSDFNQQPHLIKYLSPRLSDGHLQYKIKIAATNLKPNDQPRMVQSNSYNKIDSTMHETEV